MAAILKVRNRSLYNVYYLNTFDNIEYVRQHRSQGLDWIVQVLRPRQHSIGYMGDGFYRSKDPTNSIKVLKEMLQRNKKAQLSLTNPCDAKACQNCSNSTCLQRCRWQCWPIFMRLTAIASEIPRNSLKIQTYGVQGHPRSSILVSIESPYVTCY